MSINSAPASSSSPAWTGSPRIARMPAWISGWSVLTRPPRISGKLVSSWRLLTATPFSRSSASVPPVEYTSTPRSTSPRVKSTTPVLSNTLISARISSSAPQSGLGRHGHVGWIVADAASWYEVRRSGLDVGRSTKCSFERRTSNVQLPIGSPGLVDDLRDGGDRLVPDLGVRDAVREDGDHVAARALADDSDVVGDAVVP